MDDELSLGNLTLTVISAVAIQILDRQRDHIRLLRADMLQLRKPLSQLGDRVHRLRVEVVVISSPRRKRGRMGEKPARALLGSCQTLLPFPAIARFFPPFQVV